MAIDNIEYRIDDNELNLTMVLMIGENLNIVVKVYIMYSKSTRYMNSIVAVNKHDMFIDEGAKEYIRYYCTLIFYHLSELVSRNVDFRKFP